MEVFCQTGGVTSCDTQVSRLTTQYGVTEQMWRASGSIQMLTRRRERCSGENGLVLVVPETLKYLIPGIPKSECSRWIVTLNPNQRLQSKFIMNRQTNHDGTGPSSSIGSVCHPFNLRPAGEVPRAGLHSSGWPVRVTRRSVRGLWLDNQLRGGAASDTKNDSLDLRRGVNIGAVRHG